MIGFWTVVLAVGFISRIATLVAATLRKRQPKSRSARTRRLWNRLQLWMKFWFTTPALWSQRTAEPVGWCSVPPRLQSLTIAVFVVINVVLSCASYTLFEGNL